MILSLLWFWFVMLSLGIGVSVWVVDKRNSFVENLVLVSSYGLAGFVVLSIVMNQLRIPLVWWMFAGLGLFALGVSAGSARDKFVDKKDWGILIVLGVALGIVILMIAGAYAYPWLEDDDPYDHAVASKYVSVHHTAVKSMEQFRAYGRFYMEPYPPAYPILMGVTHQLNDSISDTLKIMNALLIGLGVLFFYLFAKELFEHKGKAVLATFVVATMPCFMSHFIWSQTLALILMFPAFYALLKAHRTQCMKWSALTVLCVVAILVAQPSTAAIFGIMFGLVWISECLVTRSFAKRTFLIGVVGVVIALGIFWVPILVKFGLADTMEGIGLSSRLFTDSNLDTSGGLVYSLKDFVVAPLNSKIDQATGVGIFACVALIFSAVVIARVWKGKWENLKWYHWVMMLWFLFGLLGTQGNALPFKLFPHRFWAFLAIPIALLVSDGVWEFSKNKVARGVLIGALIVGIVFTGLIPKVNVQTAMWPFGGNFMTMEQVKGYDWMRDNLRDGQVFVVCGNEEKAVAFDLESPVLDMSMYRFKERRDTLAPEIYDFSKEFKYVVVDASCVKERGMNATNELLNSMVMHENFRMLKQDNGIWIFQRGGI